MLDDEGGGAGCEGVFIAAEEGGGSSEGDDSCDGGWRWHGAAVYVPDGEDVSFAVNDGNDAVWGGDFGFLNGLSHDGLDIGQSHCLAEHGGC